MEQPDAPPEDAVYRVCFRRISAGAAPGEQTCFYRPEASIDAAVAAAVEALGASLEGTGQDLSDFDTAQPTTTNIRHP